MRKLLNFIKMLFVDPPTTPVGDAEEMKYAQLVRYYKREELEVKHNRYR